MLVLNASVGHTHHMSGRRLRATILLVIAIVAVAAFASGITMCIDWGGAAAPPHIYLQSGTLCLTLL